MTHQIAGQDRPRAGRVPCFENGMRPWHSSRMLPILMYDQNGIRWETKYFETAGSLTNGETIRQTAGWDRTAPSLCRSRPVAMKKVVQPWYRYCIQVEWTVLM